VWLNSAALSLYGHAGHPTGLLREDPAFEVTRLIGAVPDDLLDAWADAAARAAAARGVVGIVDLEMQWNLETWTRRMAAGADSLRVEFGIYTEHLDRAIEEGLRTGDRITQLLTVGRYKVLTDGSLNTRTAYCFDEYPGKEGQEHSHGMLTVPPETLLPRMRKAVEAGIVPTVHAIGDHANSLALDAFAELESGGRIEHAQLLAESDFARFAQLGVEASVQPDHAVDDRDIADHHWASSAGRAFAFRSLLDAGATLALGSDAPVSPLDPWTTIAAAVTRTRGDREPWHPEQRITVAEALAASTRTTVEAGQVADLIVTDRDPLTVEPHELRGFPVVATMLAGRFTHNAL
jgi:predicted amidohydrolase YtcJ